MGGFGEFTESDRNLCKSDSALFGGNMKRLILICMALGFGLAMMGISVMVQTRGERGELTYLLTKWF